jgi:hypothetical protein
MFSAALLIATGGTAWAVDAGSTATDASDQLAHNSDNAKGTCAKCHIPHGGKGDKIWASDLTGTQPFSGVHMLCNSCHNASGTGTSGRLSVFTKGAYQNHSMLAWANTAASGITFPTGTVMNASDTDTIWTVTDPDGVNSNGGFYCGSCHNVHKQPRWGSTVEFGGNGDYLRNDTSYAASNSLASFGSTGARFGACTQCHRAVQTTGTATGHAGNCMICHDPHKGETPATATTNSLIAEKILIIDLVGNSFSAPPNVGFTANTYPDQIAAMCYGCHKSGGAGAAKLIDNTLEHHTMGTAGPNAALLGGTGHAPGTAAGDNSSSFTCTNCHDMHNGAQDYYLRSSTAPGGGTYASEDDSAFCTDRCHNNKTLAGLGTVGSAHSWAVGNTKTGKGGCQLCHAMHDGPARGNANRPDINALIRVAAVNLAWSAQNADGDSNDYEDMCYGCHSSTTITTGVALTGSTLQPASYFSHKFTQTVSAGVTTNMTAAGLPKAAATTTGGGDYGAVADQLYCGTCHNVHVQSATDAQGQMFRVADNTTTVGAGLCVACHGVSGMAAGKSHPTYLDSAAYSLARVTIPNARTAAAVDPTFTAGGDGNTLGRVLNNTPGTTTTGAMTCETCHNFHTANTTRLGGILNDDSGDSGKLLLSDNNETAIGSDMCVACHGATKY